MMHPKDADTPDQIDPKYLSDARLKCDMLLRDPEVYRTVDGVETISVDPRWLEWTETPIIADKMHCGHTISVCAECADTWNEDYFVRFWADGKVVWLSHDHPDHPRPDSGDGSPPLY